MSQKKRKYQDNYLDFGFTYLIEDDLQIPQCVVCMKTFSNSTMCYSTATEISLFGPYLVSNTGFCLFSFALVFFCSFIFRS